MWESIRRIAPCPTGFKKDVAENLDSPIARVEGWSYEDSLALRERLVVERLIHFECVFSLGLCDAERDQRRGDNLRR
jgi:hypothetical protein